jgi:hypothetical protein
VAAPSSAPEAVTTPKAGLSGPLGPRFAVFRGKSGPSCKRLVAEKTGDLWQELPRIVVVPAGGLWDLGRRVAAPIAARAAHRVQPAHDRAVAPTVSSRPTSASRPTCAVSPSGSPRKTSGTTSTRTGPATGRVPRPSPCGSRSRARDRVVDQPRRERASLRVPHRRHRRPQLRPRHQEPEHPRRRARRPRAPPRRVPEFQSEVATLRDQLKSALAATLER